MPTPRLPFGLAEQALIRANAAGDYQQFLWALNGLKAHPDTVAPSGIPIACLAACRGYPSTTESLLAAGGNPNVADAKGHTPVFYAILGGESSRYMEVVHQYTSHTKYVPSVDASGMTELEWAVRCGNSVLGAMVYERTPLDVRRSLKHVYGYQELMLAVERNR